MAETTNNKAYSKYRGRVLRIPAFVRDVQGKLKSRAKDQLTWYNDFPQSLQKYAGLY